MRVNVANVVLLVRILRSYLVPVHVVLYVVLYVVVCMTPVLCMISLSILVWFYCLCLSCNVNMVWTICNDRKYCKCVVHCEYGLSGFCSEGGCCSPMLQ